MCEIEILSLNSKGGYETLHPLINKPEHEVTEEEKAMLDKVAKMTNHVNSHFKGLRELYQTSSYGRTVQSRLSEKS